MKNNIYMIISPFNVDLDYFTYTLFLYKIYE